MHTASGTTPGSTPVTGTSGVRTDSPWTSIDGLIIVSIFWLFLIFFGIQVADYPELEDDGLFVLASHFMGTTHSPGYPLFVLLSQVTAVIPFGTAAFKVHLFGSAVAALGLCTLYYLGRVSLNVERLPALAGVGCLSVSSLFLEQAQLAEAYQLNGLLFLVLLVISSRLRTDRQPLILLCAGLIYGLSLSNHWPLTLLMTPAYLLLAFPAVPAIARYLHWVLAGLLAGLVPYLWMYVSATDEKFSHMGAFPGLADFFYFVSRGVYADVDSQVIASLQDKLLYVRFYGTELTEQYSMMLLPLVIHGLIETVRQGRARWFATGTYLLMFPLLLIGLLDFTYTQIEAASIRTYFLTTYLVMGLLLMVSLNVLYRKAGNRMIVAVVLCVLPVIMAVQSQSDRILVSHSGRVEAHASYVLQALPPASALFVMDSWLMPGLAYLHYIEGMRPDIRLISEHGTFLPGRLFNYFDVPNNEKQVHVARYIASSPGPVFALAGPERYSSEFSDRGYAYQLKVPGERPSAVVIEQLAGLLRQPPVGDWETLYYESIVRRVSPYLVIAELDRAYFEQNFLLTLLAAEQLVLMPGDRVAVTQVAGLLQQAETLVAGRSDFDEVRLLIVKGHLMMRIGSMEVAEQLYRSALDRIPVSHSTAVDALRNLYGLTCNSTGMSSLNLKFPGTGDPGNAVDVTCPGDE